MDKMRGKGNHEGCETELNLKDIDAVYKKIEKKLDKLLRENDYMSAFDLLDIEINRAPSVPAVPLDKLCKLCQEIDVRVPCVLCNKIMPEWCKANNKFPMTFDKEFKCPKWKQLLTKWMEKMNE